MDRISIHVRRTVRPSERVLKGAMLALAILFLLLGILLSRGMMLPCFLMAMAWLWYGHATRRDYEYVLENEVLKVDRLMERGRVTLHEIPFREFQILARPDDPAVALYRKGGGEKVKKYDYTSYADGVPWYTLIAREDGETVKLLLDLNDEAIRAIRRSNREAVRV